MPTLGGGLPPGIPLREVPLGALAQNLRRNTRLHGDLDVIVDEPTIAEQMSVKDLCMSVTTQTVRCQSCSRTSCAMACGMDPKDLLLLGRWSLDGSGQQPIAVHHASTLS